MQNARGKAFVFGDDVNTDVILPGKYLNVTDPQELALHCMESADPGFAKKAAPGDILVARKNFGCGSSREHAPLSIKYLGISCVIASTFARIFFRNALNIGLPILECDEAARGIRPGDEVEVDFDSGRITNVTLGQTFQAAPLPPFMQNLIASGGLVSYARKNMGK
ncbi:3-isopropylmalate dehydratase small subunit [uncultured Mailhella sp.]|uniref:3-isopropylmalate dehydratase small subunit n=1 Tax=uncultured Mailhella sp. TaxID=1981031 RepID=UPI00260B82B0|nr:3-isopropylmalate dehydratase small subunit [uncultured Mailhella sp.]